MKLPGRRPPAGGSGRILFPFLGSVLSRESLEATLRLARAQDATLMPSYLAVVPPALSLEAPLGGECEGALALLELIEQRARRAGVAVDSRIATPAFAEVEVFSMAVTCAMISQSPEPL